MSNIEDGYDADRLRVRQDLLAAVMRAFPAKMKPAYGRNSPRFEELFDDSPHELVQGMLSFRMNMAIGKWRVILERLVAKDGLSLNGWHVLFAISLNGPDETMTEIAKRLTASNAAIVRTLNELEAAGYIERKVSRRDKRTKLLSLTKAGEQIIYEQFYNIDEARKMLLAGVSLAEMELVTEILDRMDANLDEMLEKAPFETVDGQEDIKASK